MMGMDFSDSDSDKDGSPLSARNVEETKEQVQELGKAKKQVPR